MYIYDKKWEASLDHDECPYCCADIHVKQNDVKECQLCNLRVEGDYHILAYKLEEPLQIHIPLMVDVCVECGSDRLVDNGLETACLNCGMVQYDIYTYRLTGEVYYPLITK